MGLFMVERDTSRTTISCCNSTNPLASSNSEQFKRLRCVDNMSHKMERLSAIKQQVIADQRNKHIFCVYKNEIYSERYNVIRRIPDTDIATLK